MIMVLNYFVCTRKSSLANKFTTPKGYDYDHKIEITESNQTAQSDGAIMIWFNATTTGAYYVRIDDSMNVFFSKADQSGGRTFMLPIYKGMRFKKYESTVPSEIGAYFVPYKY